MADERPIAPRDRVLPNVCFGSNADVREPDKKPLSYSPLFVLNTG